MTSATDWILLEAGFLNKDSKANHSLSFIDF